jgi:hypothetical protein
VYGAWSLSSMAGVPIITPATPTIHDGISRTLIAFLTRWLGS